MGGPGRKGRVTEKVWGHQGGAWGSLCETEGVTELVGTCAKLGKFLGCQSHRLRTEGYLVRLGSVGGVWGHGGGSGRSHGVGFGSPGGGAAGGIKGRDGGRGPGARTRVGRVRPPSSRLAAGLGQEEGGHDGLGTFPGPCARPASHLGAVDPLFPEPPT